MNFTITKNCENFGYSLLGIETTTALGRYGTPLSENFGYSLLGIETIQRNIRKPIKQVKILVTPY